MLAAFMVIVFLILGFLLLFTDFSSDVIPRPNRYYVGGVLVVWSVFRAWMAWRKYQVSRQEDEHDDDDEQTRRRFR